jgi:hypothetical protein
MLPSDPGSDSGTASGPETQDAFVQDSLRRFWSRTIFSLGILWGFGGLVYIPVAVLTSLRGGSIAEVVLIVSGGLLIFPASIFALYHRRPASLLLLLGGILLLAVASALPWLPFAQTFGAANRLLTLSSGVVATALGLFGVMTEARRWPRLH